MDGDARLDELRSLLGERGLVTDAEAMPPYLEDWRGLADGKAVAIARPATTEEVAAVVRWCAETGTAAVPQGGVTGLVNASAPHGPRAVLVLSLDRMNRVLEVDPVTMTLTAEAGCILQQAQEAAAAEGLRLPLRIGAEGSARLGGNLATNAGGNLTIRYGNTRELCLGLEVVLPDGRVLDELKRLRKDNTGYDLKQLFVGAEGTLGIITAATLKLQPQPLETATAFCAVRDVAAALELLGRCQQATAQSLTSFELIPRMGIELSLKHVRGSVDPLAGAYAWYVLVEAKGGHGDGGLKSALEDALMRAYEDGLVLDAAPAESAGQAQAFWHLREAVVEAQRHEGGSIKHDIAVPVSSVPAFLEDATAKVEELIPGIRPVPFGHLGDGNLHFNLTQPEDADTQAFLARWEEVNAAVHDIVARYRGSISAEHGIGQMKVAENARFKPPVELELMRAIKRTLDPHNIMNPGKVVDVG